MIGVVPLVVVGCAALAVAFWLIQAGHVRDDAKLEGFALGMACFAIALLVTVGAVVWNQAG